MAEIVAASLAARSLISRFPKWPVRLAAMGFLFEVSYFQLKFYYIGIFVNFKLIYTFKFITCSKSTI